MAGCKVGDRAIFHANSRNAGRMCEVVAPSNDWPNSDWVVRAMTGLEDQYGRRWPAGALGCADDADLIPLPGLHADESESTDQPIAEVA